MPVARSVPYLRRLSDGLSRRSGVVVQQPTETLLPANATDAVPRTSTLNQLVAQPLMIPLAMIVRDILGDGSSQMALAERNQAIETFFFDRAHEAFRVGIRIRGLIRRLYDADSRLTQPRTHRR